VVIIGMDLGLRKLDISLGIADSTVYDIVDVIYERAPLRQALVHDKRFYELYILGASQTSGKDVINPGQMKKLCERLKTEFDYVIIDCPAGMESGFVNSVCAADRAVIVIVPEPASVRDADRVASLLDQYGVRNMKLLLNRVRIDLIERGDMMAIDDVVNTVSIPLIGIIPEDDAVIAAVNRAKPVVMMNGSKAALCFKNTAKRICGYKIPLAKLKADGVFTRVIKAIKNK